MPLGVPSETVLNGGVNRSGNRVGRSSGNTAPPSGSTTPRAFTPTPEYSNVGAWSGWDDKFVAPHGGFGMDTPQNIFSEVSGALGRGTTQRDYYTNQYGAELVKQAQQSGMDPQTFFALGPAAQQQAVAWGTNLGNARSIVPQQQQQYQANQQQRTANNDYIDQYGSLQANLQDQLLGQYTSGAGMAQGRYDLGYDQLEQGYHTDRALLGERQYRDVDLARRDNSAGLLNNANQRGVLDERRGIRGTMFQNQQDYLNDQAGFLNRSQDNAYGRFQSNDAYLGQQGRDLMAQYGFAGREFAQNQEGAFANRETQKRGATSDAAARGAFGSAGFGDNIQDIYGQYGRAMDENTLQLDRTNQSIDERDRAIGNDRANLRFNYTDTTIGFDRDKRGLEKGHADNKTGYQDDLASFRGQYSSNDYERSRLQNVDAGLDSLAREYGIKKQDLRNQFDNAVTKMGLDLNETMSSLEQMLNSGNAQLQAQGMSFMQQMMAYQ